MPAWANNLLAGFAHRWPPDQPRAWVQANACRAKNLDPLDVGLGLYLRTSVCLISLASENQDGGQSLVTDWWEAEF